MRQPTARAVRAAAAPPSARSAPSRLLNRTLLFAATFVLAFSATPLTAAGGGGAGLPAQPDEFTAATDEAAAQQAAREIRAARDRANAAAEAFFQAESDLDLLQDELERLVLESEQLVLAVERLRRDVESVAVARYVLSGTSGIPLLTGLQAPQDQIQAGVFVDVLTNTGADVLDQFDIAQKQLVANEVALDEQQREIERQQVRFTELRKIAEEEVVELRKSEEGRLQDEAVRRALEAQLAEERAQLEELARRQAEAAARAIPDPAVGLPPPTTTTTTIPGAVPADEIPVDGIPVDPADAPPIPDGVIVDGTTTVPAPTTTEPLPTTTALPANSGASGGTSGGRTGSGGTGSNPRPVDTTAGYLDTIVCPMPGSAYGDTWGAPRSGGRRHEGVDMIAPRGIPIFAVTSGYVTFKFNRLGGNAVSLKGDNGNRYYYGHLDSYEGVSRRVLQGEIIGYNGDTGNAKFSTPHLHFEIHPGGGLAINPYPSVRLAGC
ncbi:MAG: peptidoglycan DD-metalloendopeptidase family protein [Ilumatobacter sp.]|nr:peptidoglycan DD-metalloendopeptidase family protein [Ilumatobacter sp.]